MEILPVIITAAGLAFGAILARSIRQDSVDADLSKSSKS